MNEKLLKDNKKIAFTRKKYSTSACIRLQNIVTEYKITRYCTWVQDYKILYTSTRLHVIVLEYKITRYCTRVQDYKILWLSTRLQDIVHEYKITSN